VKSYLPGGTPHTESTNPSHVSRIMSKLIYVTRHPVTYALSRKGDVLDNLVMWEKEQFLYYSYFHHYPDEAKIHIRYEDILLSLHRLAKVFQFVGLEFDQQYLRYGEFQQQPDITSDSRLFALGIIDPEAVDYKHWHGEKSVEEWWSSRKDSDLIKVLGYDKWNLGE